MWVSHKVTQQVSIVARILRRALTCGLQHPPASDTLTVIMTRGKKVATILRAEECDLYPPASCHHATVQRAQMWKLRLGEGNALLRAPMGFGVHQSDPEPRSFFCSSVG